MPARNFILILSLLPVLVVTGCGDPAPATGLDRVEPQAAIPRDRPLKAAFLVVDGVFNTELTAPYDIFQHTVYHTGDLPGIEVYTVSPDGEEVTTFEGIHIRPDYGFDNVPAPDILVVPSAEGSMDRYLEDADLIDWVRRTGEKALYVVSLCDGAFVLAKAGLLDHVTCTTFPGDQTRFAREFPNSDLRREPGYVHDGKMLTSPGGALSFDVAMYLVDHLYGEKVAAGVGKGLIIHWPPPPGANRGLVVHPKGADDAS